MADRAPELYGIPISELARICRVSLKTARRWKLGQTVPPKSALMLLSGDLGCLDPAWSGWIVRDGSLWSPEGWQVRMESVLAIPLLRGQLHALQSENRRFRRLDIQPVQDAPEVTVVVKAS